MKRIVLWAVLLAAPVVAQTPASEARVNKLVTLRYVDPNQVAPMFNQWGVSITPNSQIKTLSIIRARGQGGSGRGGDQATRRGAEDDRVDGVLRGGRRPGDAGRRRGAAGLARCDHATQGRVHVQGLQNAGRADAAHEGRVVGGNLGHSECGQPSADVTVLDPQRHGERGRDDDSHRPHACRAAHSFHAPRRRRAQMPRAAPARRNPSSTSIPGSTRTWM